jgi:hypothetical protein
LCKVFKIDNLYLDLRRNPAAKQEKAQEFDPGCSQSLGNRLFARIKEEAPAGCRGFFIDLFLL